MLFLSLFWVVNFLLDILFVDVYYMDIYYMNIFKRETGKNMESKTVTISANFPSTDDFAMRYPQYGPFAKGDGYFIFETIMTPINFLSAKVCTELGFPAVAGVAESCFKAVENQDTLEWGGYLKQFIGAVVCTLMEANTYEKTGKKKSVPHHAFTKGEVYKLIGDTQ
jgi:hypothetical protein